MSYPAENDAAPWRFSGLSVEQSAAVLRLMAQAWNEGANAATLDYGIGAAVNPYERPIPPGESITMNSYGSGETHDLPPDQGDR